MVSHIFLSIKWATPIDNCSTIHCYLTCRTSISSDFVCICINSADNIVHILVANFVKLKGIKEVVNKKGKVMLSDTSAMMDMTKGLACISDRAIKSRTKKLLLHATQLVHNSQLTRDRHHKHCILFGRPDAS